MISATMLAGPSTLADLRKAGIVSSQEVVAAIDLYLRDPAAGPYRFASGHSIDIATLVDPSPASEKVARSRPLDAAIRTALAAAIMAAHPTPP
ncbi:hypothetical protein MKK84_04505 [Methylobacterium sp. E-065]|uniref:hypothetical protein n=1 Tax=Methylobacterium sp. E-065 TaxID=2836583 RepID=UPI001FB8CE01|nr:hypothetical protein [Methylobacterium sp. E-065]MCJ2016693.1 hypothetical protein [Methylobacterium sp. E-065]